MINTNLMLVHIAYGEVVRALRRFEQFYDFAPTASHRASIERSAFTLSWALSCENAVFIGMKSGL